jgi:hypothetical protein
MLYPRVNTGLSQSVAARVSNEVLIAGSVDVARTDQPPELFGLQRLASDQPLQLSDDWFMRPALRVPRHQCHQCPNESSSVRRIRAPFNRPALFEECVSDLPDRYRQQFRLLFLGSKEE